MKKNSRAWKVLVYLLLVVFTASVFLAGCSGAQENKSPTTQETNATGELKSGKGKKVGFSIAMLAGSPFWQIIADELERGFKELDYEFVCLDAQGDLSKQSSDVEDLIAQQVDMLLINPYDSKAIVPVTNRAKQAGIPVFAVDIPVDEEGYVEATCICDNQEIGYNLGWYAGGLFSSPDVRVVLISGYPGGIDSYQRRMGFIEGIHNYQLEKFNRTGVEIVYHGWGDYAFDPANKTMEDASIRVGNNFDILYAENDAMAMGALQAMEEAGIAAGKVIIGVDGWKQMYELIKEGKATATGLNSPTELAAVTVDAVHKFLNGVEIPNWIYTTPDVVDKNNVDKYYDPNSIF